MTIIIDNSITSLEFSRILDKIYRPRKKLNAKAFCGKISFDKDPLALQKMWRDEW